ncbi:TonB-dependent receptor, partial [candidate division WOR-3 bacterium]|nr:TonB-dependent receptor [candidate division WOR-3 bacterium]
MSKRWTIMVSVILIGTLMVLSPAVAVTSGTGSIEGKVMNRQTGKPLPLANVILKGNTLGTAADEDGYYIIPEVPVGRYRVIVSMIGYKAVIKTIEVAGDEVSVFDFELYPTVIPMGEIIITATKTEHFLGDIPVLANVITREEMELANIETASQAVKYLPGVYAQGGFGWVKEAAKLQGLDPQYTLLLLDGQKLRGAPKYSADLSQYPAEMIERVEVV